MTAQCGSVTVSFTYGSLPYEGQSYKTIKIGTQTWMAENLNYTVDGSKCYRNLESNCNVYGRLYNWSTAMDFASSCNSSSCSSQIQSKHRGICPSGWHIPNDYDWGVLTDYVGGGGLFLKAESGWSSGNGVDSYGFSALPGGFGNSGGSFGGVGNEGYWWSATENNASSAYRWNMTSNNSSVWKYDLSKSNLYSVRCVQD
jgi:uncharacterized protein (TIGR02145 family)